MRVLLTAVCAMVLAGCGTPKPTQPEGSCLQTIFLETGNVALSNVCDDRSVTVIDLATGDEIVVESGSTEKLSGKRFTVVK